MQRNGGVLGAHSRIGGRHRLAAGPSSPLLLHPKTDIEIEGSDWSGTFLRKDQQQYLCKRASGVNPITKISTKESLMCPE